MTIIAATDGIMVADGVCFQSDLMAPCPQPKIARAPDGGLVGATGSQGDGWLLREWVRAGMDFDRPPKLSFTDTANEISILWLWLRPDGMVHMGDCTMKNWPVPQPVAIGYGVLYLHGLLDAGLELEQAVQRVIQRVPYLGGPVQIERLLNSWQVCSACGAPLKVANSFTLACPECSPGKFGA